MEWFEAVDSIRPHVVRLSTPRGSGTGFLISHGKNRALVGIATAAHVVDHAHYWEEPVRIEHFATNESTLVRVDERAMFIDKDSDTAAVLFEKGNLPLPTETLSLAPKGKFLKVGNDIGWLGFPAISSASLCFFGGRISAYLSKDKAYLVDGVAISGVSGGPAFHQYEESLVIMGVVSAYVPNRATGEVLPGLAVVRGVKHFHDLAPTFASLDQAKEQESPPSIPLSESGGEEPKVSSGKGV